MDKLVTWIYTKIVDYGLVLCYSIMTILGLCILTGVL
jgi:hypothetical protein